MAWGQMLPILQRKQELAGLWLFLYCWELNHAEDKHTRNLGKVLSFDQCLKYSQKDVFETAMQEESRQSGFTDSPFISIRDIYQFIHTYVYENMNISLSPFPSMQNKPSFQILLLPLLTLNCIHCSVLLRGQSLLGVFIKVTPPFLHFSFHFPESLHISL